MAAFQISQSSGQYWYRLRTDNGEIVQSSEDYTSKASCQHGIRSVQANCQPHRFESFFNAGQYGFSHVAANGEIIGRSEKYTTAQSRDHGIQLVLREASEARIEDPSERDASRSPSRKSPLATCQRAFMLSGLVPETAFPLCFLSARF